jgi:hypothetical protein
MADRAAPGPVGRAGDTLIAGIRAVVTGSIADFLTAA